MVVVIVGGTALARRLAGRLDAAGVDVWTTLAGATRTRATVLGKVHVGGFGTDDSMATWLNKVSADVVVDATHAFAATMTTRVEAVRRLTGLPCLRLESPSWAARPDASSWRWVNTHDDAATAIDQWYTGTGKTVIAEPTASNGSASDGEVFIAVGRQELNQYYGVGTSNVVARVIDEPDGVPQHWTVITSRGPYTVEAERTFFAAHRISVVVSKDSGGDGASAKLDVAAEQDLPVVMIRRPDPPHGMDTAATVADAATWIHQIHA